MEYEHISLIKIKDDIDKKSKKYSNARAGKAIKEERKNRAEVIPYIPGSAIVVLVSTFLAFHLLRLENTVLNFFGFMASLCITALAIIFLFVGIQVFFTNGGILRNEREKNLTRFPWEEKIFLDKVMKYVHQAVTGAQKVNACITEWNDYVEALELELAKPVPREEEAFELITKAKTQVARELDRVDFLLRRGDREIIDSFDLPDLLDDMSESVRELVTEFEANMELGDAEHLTGTVAALQSEDVDTELGKASAILRRDARTPA